MVKPRRASGPEFKAQAAEIVSELRWSVAEVAGDPGLGEGPSRGRPRALAGVDRAFSGQGDLPSPEEQRSDCGPRQATPLGATS